MTTKIVIFLNPMTWGTYFAEVRQRRDIVWTPLLWRHRGTLSRGIITMETLCTGEPVAVETQNFASLLWGRGV